MTVAHSHTNGSTPLADTTPWLAAAKPRSVDPEMRQRFENHLAEVFTALGMDLSTPRTADTPRRFLQAMFELVDAGLVDELFLTLAPQLAGRSDSIPRLSLVEDVAFDAGTARWARLVDLRHVGDHLFSR